MGRTVSNYPLRLMKCHNVCLYKSAAVGVIAFWADFRQVLTVLLSSALNCGESINLPAQKIGEKEMTITKKMTWRYRLGALHCLDTKRMSEYVGVRVHKLAACAARTLK